LERLELLIVQDLTLAPHLTTHAQIVFPAASFAEAGGTLTNLEGREQSWEAAIPAFGQSLPDWKIPAQLAARMGGSEAAYGDIESVRADLRATLPAKSARLKAPARKNPSPRIPKDAFLLIAERNAFAYRSFSITRGVAGMHEVKTDEDCVLIHPQDASARGIKPDDMLRMESNHGVDRKRVRLSAEILPGTLVVSINPVEGSPLFVGSLPREKSLPVRFSIADAETGRTERPK
jgi:anaerobic selenocysteine-containing dehydrogenase